MRVFDLTVDEEHEFFANGIVVSNCDGGLYAYRRYINRRTEEPPPPPVPQSPEWYAEEERRMREAATQQSRAAAAEERMLAEGYGEGYEEW